MGIQEIRARFEEAQEALAAGPEAEKRLSELICLYREDGRAGVQALVRRGEKQLDALSRERERMREMKRFEREYGAAGLVCGIDEAGRGPLAGPVVAGAVILPEKEIRLELLFLANALIALLGIIATVNGRTAVAGVTSVDWPALGGVTSFVAAGLLLGVAVFRIKQKRMNKKQK